MAMEWHPQYSVNDQKIDDQHKKLFAMGARLYALAGKDADMCSFHEILEGLVAYTKDHFTHEEAYLLRNGYSKREQHLLEHQDFIDRVNGFLLETTDASHDGDAAGKDAAGSERLGAGSAGNDRIFRAILFVTEWISRHISQSDKDYSKEFRKKGIQA